MALSGNQTMNVKTSAVLILALQLGLFAPLSFAVLTIEQAEQIAARNDPGITQTLNRAKAIKSDAISQSQFPDPVVILGAQNLPTDTFKFDQEPMTQFRVGVRQMFPQGDSLSLKAGKLNTQAASMDSAASVRYLINGKQVRSLWLEVMYWNRATEILREDESLFTQLQEVTHSLYSVGQVQQQDVLRAELELSRLREKIIKAERQAESQRALLSRWVGLPALNEPWPDLLPVLPSPRNAYMSEIAANSHPVQNLADEQQQILDSLREHPMLVGLQRQVDVAEHDIRLMQQQYKPAWGVELSYGYRDGDNNDGSDRADFFSAMVNVSVPLFTGNRQDKSVQSATYQKASQQNAYQDKLLEMVGEVRSLKSRLVQTNEQLALFDEQILSKARQQAEASLSSYQAASSGFSDVMRAYISEQKDRLDYERLLISRLQIVSDLQFYFFTETPDWVLLTGEAQQ